MRPKIHFIFHSSPFCMDFFVYCLLDYFSSIVFLWYPGVRLKIAFCQLCIPLCGRFGHDKGGVADYVDRVWSKYAAKWDMLCPKGYLWWIPWGKSQEQVFKQTRIAFLLWIIFHGIYLTLPATRTGFAV